MKSHSERGMPGRWRTAGRTGGGRSAGCACRALHGWVCMQGVARLGSIAQLGVHSRYCTDGRVQGIARLGVHAEHCTDAHVRRDIARLGVYAHHCTSRYALPSWVCMQDTA